MISTLLFSICGLGLVAIGVLIQSVSRAAIGYEDGDGFHEEARSGMSASFGQRDSLEAVYLNLGQGI